MTHIYPSNEEIAQVLEELAIYSEFEGETPHKSRAYKNASRVIRGMGFSLADLVNEGEDLKQFSGIGKNIEKKIKEIVQTGSLKKLHELREKYPSGLLEILNIPGLGLKKVIYLYKEHGISNPRQLYTFAKQGRLKTLSGFGEKSEKKIIGFLEKYLTQKKTFKLAEVDPFVQQIIEYLEGGLKREDFLIGGSWRRKKEVVGNIDVIIKDKLDIEPYLRVYACNKNAFFRKAGQNKWEWEFQTGLKVVVRAIEPSRWGSFVVFYTGSKKFNNMLFEYAKSKFDIKDLWNSSLFLGMDEEECFNKLDLQFIPPELREGRGEIDFALQGRLPFLIELEDICGDLHIHTTYTDGKNTIEEYVEAALLKGYQYIGITDHSKRMKMVGGLDVDGVRKQIQEIDNINKKIQGLKVLKGIEVDILEDGSLDLPDSILKELDFVIASIHSKFGLSKEEQTRRILRAMKNPYVSIIGHPTGRIIGRREPYEIDMEQIIDCARESGCILELNSQPDRLDLNDKYLKWAKEAGVKICINSDAHHVYGLDLLKYGIYQARRGWLESDDVINTMTIEELIEFLARKPHLAKC